MRERPPCAHGRGDDAVLEKFDEILSPELVADVILRIRELVEGGRGFDVRDQLAQELVAAEAQVANLTDAIAIGGDLPALVRRLKAAEERRQELCARMQQVMAGAPRLRIDWRTTERLARHTLQDLRGLLTRQVSEGRELLRRLLRAPIRFTPFADAGRRGYRFDGQAVLDQMFGGVIEVIGMASPPGFEPGFQP